MSTAARTVPDAGRNAVAEMVSRLRDEGREPNLFIIGAQKAGTTAVARRLQRHPETFVTRVKEPNFFCLDIRADRFARAFRKLRIESEQAAVARARHEDVLYAYIESPTLYAGLFDGAEGHALRCEASVTYLFSPAAAEAIGRLLPDARIVVILRDPVLRALSHYRMQVRAGVESEPDFVKAVLADHRRAPVAWGQKQLYVEAGLYARQLRPWFATVPRQRIHVAFFETLLQRQDPEVVAALDRFLGVAPSPDAVVEGANAGGDPRSPLLNRLLYRTGLKGVIQRALPAGLKDRGKQLFYAGAPSTLSAESRARLAPLFAEDGADLERLLDEPLPWRQQGPASGSGGRGAGVTLPDAPDDP